MSYQQQINELKNNIHKDIVKMVIAINPHSMDYHLILDEPVDITVTYYRPYGGDGTEKLSLQGIDCITGELIALNEKLEDSVLRYSDLSADQLVDLFKTVETKKYKTIILA